MPNLGAYTCEVTTTTTLKLMPKSLPLNLTSCHLLYKITQNSLGPWSLAKQVYLITSLFCWIILPMSESEPLKSLWSPLPLPPFIIYSGTMASNLVSISLLPDLLPWPSSNIHLLSPKPYNILLTGHQSFCFSIPYIVLENCAKTLF